MNQQILVLLVHSLGTSKDFFFSLDSRIRPTSGMRIEAYSSCIANLSLVYPSMQVFDPIINGVTSCHDTSFVQLEFLRLLQLNLSGVLIIACDILMVLSCGVYLIFRDHTSLLVGSSSCACFLS